MPDGQRQAPHTAAFRHNAPSTRSLPPIPKYARAIGERGHARLLFAAGSRRFLGLPVRKGPRPVPQADHLGREHPRLEAARRMGIQVTINLIVDPAPSPASSPPATTGASTSSTPWSPPRCP
ncbi:hypothetical protein GCM10010330_35890 [Streptomyces tendae]|nr:hypothetical protein GCM10010330_35890 [Streptomyces tendae]